MLSIIIPVYNVEQYLPQCVDSVLAQTVRDMEVILVDDGSPDNCGAICDEYAGKDGRVVALHKENGGLMSAWKYGLMKSKGDIIGFVDSDDWIEADMYEKMLSVMDDSGAEIVMSSLIREYDDRQEKEPLFVKPGFYDRSGIEKELFPVAISNGGMLDRGVSPNRVTKIFSRELLERNLKYCDEHISLGEDLVTTFACLCDARSVFITDFYTYHYRIRGTSIMGSFNPEFTRQAVQLNTALTSIAEDKNVFDFSGQIANDAVSLVYYGIEKNIAAAGNEAKRMRSYIKDSFSYPLVQNALEGETLSAASHKCRIYRIIMKTFGAGALYLFIRYVVLLKRKYFGY